MTLEAAGLSNRAVVGTHRSPDGTGGLRLSAILASAGAEVLRAPHGVDAETTVTGVTLFGDGDPTPAPDTIVLCASTCVPDARVVVVRESAADVLLVSGRATVLTVPDRLPWIEIYDAVRRCFSEHAIDAAEDDLFAIADALAAAAGGAVAIEDADRRVLAFSTIPGQPIDRVRRDGILGRQVPEHVERDDWYRRLWRSDGVVEYEHGPESSDRLAIAVRAGGERLGSIWIVGNRASLDPGADDALERALPTVARCLLHQQRFNSRTRDARATLLRRLLTGGADGEVAELSDRSVVVVAIRQDAPHTDRELLDMRLADLFSLHAHRVGESGLAAVLDDVVWAVLPWVDRRHLEQQLGMVLARTPYPTRIAVSDVVDDFDALPTAAGMTERLVALDEGRSGVVGYVADNRSRLALAAIAQAVAVSMPDFSRGLAARVREHDEEHGTQYAATLRAWFDANGDVGRGAKQLHVHPNTFRYRISRAVELFGIDFDDADERLLLHLQLRITD